MSSVLCSKRGVVTIGILLLTMSLFLIATISDKALLVRLNQINVAVEPRLTWWDGHETPEEIYCLSGHNASQKERVPDTAHFILLANKGEDAELSFTKFLAMKAAIITMEVREIKIHTFGLNKDNQYWVELRDRKYLLDHGQFLDLKSSLDVTLVEWERNALRVPGGLTLEELGLAHQSDIMRLQILDDEGGIYLDNDVFVLRPFTELLDNPRDTIMGHEGGNRYGLCNAVIVSRANSEFLIRWRDRYSDFNPHRYNYHSVLLPKRLQVQFATEKLICPLAPRVFFWPTWSAEHVKFMHEPLDDADKIRFLEDMRAFDGAMYENQLAFHGWGGHRYLKALTPQRIERQDTRFNLLLRKINATPLQPRLVRRDLQ